jgi:type VI secretion system protein ImpK
MDTLLELTRECFGAIACLRSTEDDVISPQTVQDGLRLVLDRFKERGRQAGIPDRDLQDASYALVALADEVALAGPESLRNFWMTSPLQFQIFGENAAGEGFFVRLDRLLLDERRMSVLVVYQLCLSFGFQGKCAFPGGEIELMRIRDSLRHRLQPSDEESGSLSPAGEAPDEPLVRSARAHRLLWVSLAILALGLMTFVGLRLSFDHQVSGLAARVDEIAP